MQRLITAREVLAGPVGQRIKDGAVLIDGDAITATGPREEIERAADDDAVRSDYPRHAILPGLINCHVHLAFNSGQHVVDELRATGDSALLLGMAGRAQQALTSGVTTVRDLGDRDGLVFQVRAAIERGELLGPRILAAGPPLTPPRGHCWFFGGEVDGPDAIRERIRRNAALGADVIKVMASGGSLTPESVSMREEQFGVAELKLIVREARDAGLPVAAHAHGSDSIAAATEAGVDTIEHCTWMRTGGEGHDRRDDVARAMAGRGVRACVAWPPKWRELMQALGPEAASNVVERLRWMEDLGVPLITGTDAGVSQRSGFGDFVGALELYEHVGFPLERIIELATTDSATGIGQGDRIGRIAPGYAADLLVVEGDPLSDLAALRELRLVLAAGRVVPLP